MLKKFLVFDDPGHGWAKVPRTLLKELDIVDKISTCSYQRGENVYLEEDCDATTFVNAYNTKYGFDPKFISKHTEKQCKIRSYESYDKNK
jgi:hypothetical protein